MIAASNGSSSIHLIAQDPAGATRSYELSGDQGVFVGSSANCGLQLPGDGIGDIHCRIGFEDGKLQVQDWMSATGTRVNGQVIESSAPISPGDVVEIGQQKIKIGNQASGPAINSEPAIDCVEEQSDQSSERQSFADDRVDDQEFDGRAFDLDARAELNATGDNAIEALQEVASDSSSDAIVSPEPIGIDEFDGGSADLGLLVPESMDFDADFSEWEEEETFDRETVELLRAEIEDLQAQLAQRDSDQLQSDSISFDSTENTVDSSAVDQRMQELIDEANRSDERAALLEEMLHAAEDSSRNEIEERSQLEGWVSDIESRLSQREEEHEAEVEALRQRLETAQQEQEQLQRRLGQAAHGGNAPRQYEETLEKLQQANRQLQEQLAESRKQLHALEKQLEEAEGTQEGALREERASIAKEQARLSRMRFELSRKVAEVENLPKEVKEEEQEMSHKIRALRQHLREIHEEEKKEEAEASLTSRLAKLWKRVEY
ncbi:MAG: FHA domain-containing protein [Planctomycetota bacterium]